MLRGGRGGSDVPRLFGWTPAKRARAVLWPPEQVSLWAVRVLATVAAGSNTQTQAVVEAGGVAVLSRMLSAASSDRLIQEICFTLSNITAGTRAQIQVRETPVDRFDGHL